MTVISLLTDFGNKDGFVGVMKGVIWGIAPQAQIADISHEVAPQNVLQGAILLEKSYRYFPAGSVHVAVIDPGVGTARRAIAARIGEHYFVAPDNGLLTAVLQDAETRGELVDIVQLDQPQFWLPDISRSFHGRDIFAPVGAHLAQGTPLNKIGSPAGEVILLDMPQPQDVENGWEAQVILVDVFGNLITNLSEDLLAGRQVATVACRGKIVQGVQNTFGEAQVGDLIAMLDSSGRLSLCVVNGSAAESLRAAVGDPVTVKLA